MIEASYKKVRFHILLIFRIITEKENLPYLNSNKSESYCNFLLSVLYNDKKALDMFKKCTYIIDSADFDKSDKQAIKLVSKTKNLIEFARSYKSKL